jgi:hypothetical protein
MSGSLSVVQHGQLVRLTKQKQPRDMNIPLGMHQAVDRRCPSACLCASMRRACPLQVDHAACGLQREPSGPMPFHSVSSREDITTQSCLQVIVVVESCRVTQTHV